MEKVPSASVRGIEGNKEADNNVYVVVLEEREVVP